MSKINEYFLINYIYFFCQLHKKSNKKKSPLGKWFDKTTQSSLGVYKLAS